MPTEEPSPMTVDENVRRRFEAAWREGRPERIEDFFDSEDHPAYLATVEELIHIELEWWWKDWTQSGPQTLAALSSPPLIEAYLARFPQLNQPAIVLRLLQQEYLVRHRYGDRPAADEYHARFPDLVPTGREVQTTPSEFTCTALGQNTIPGYQILGVLGRGGMGVVYKARHTKLNRLVALKMILSGHHADEQELTRFRGEAEAVARLQHPNIVQIYEVGEHDGLPYLALEFVNGGSLAEMVAGRPRPGPAAAQVVETVARAVHAAHQRGIIHRDLKPANILLQKSEIRNPKSASDSTPAPSDFGFRISDLSPKVTDFGLAKQLDREASRTRTGPSWARPATWLPSRPRAEPRRSARRSMSMLSARSCTRC